MGMGTALLVPVPIVAATERDAVLIGSVPLIVEAVCPLILVLLHKTLLFLEVSAGVHALVEASGRRGLGGDTGDVGCFSLPEVGEHIVVEACFAISVTSFFRS
jgi:hypothetical protein